LAVKVFFSVWNMQEAGNMDNAFQVYIKMIYSMDLIQHILPENRVKLEEWFKGYQQHLVRL